MTRFTALVAGAWKRVLQVFALYAPGAQTLRPALHRLRGVAIGQGVFIGTSVLIETARPELVSIGNHVSIGVRAVVIAHWRESTEERLRRGATHTVVLEDNAYVGPGVIILPNVTVGEGAVVQPGSVVSADVPPHVMVQGNPAKPVAFCRVPLVLGTSRRAFLAGLRPIGDGASGTGHG